jgi:hypothetical protein
MTCARIMTALALTLTAAIAVELAVRRERPAPVRRNVAPEPERDAGLERRAHNISFDNLPLEEALARLARSANAQIHVSRWSDNDMYAGAIDRRAPITLTLRDISLRGALKAVLQQLKLPPESYHVEDGIIIITADPPAPVSVYDIRDLVDPPTKAIILNPDYDPTIPGSHNVQYAVPAPVAEMKLGFLLNAIADTSVTYPDVTDNDILNETRIPGVWVTNASPQRDLRYRQLLAQLRQSIGSHAALPPCDSAPETLERRLPELHIEKMPMAQAIDLLREKYQANIRVAWDELAQLGFEIGPETPITLHRFSISLDEALKACATEGNESMNIREDGELITLGFGGDEFHRETVRIYDIRDLLRSGGSERSADSIIQQIKSEIHLETWEFSGTIRQWGGRLFISHDYRTHRDIEALLKRLRTSATSRPLNSESQPSSQ